MNFSSTTIRFFIVRVRDAIVSVPYEAMFKISTEVDMLILCYMGAYYIMDSQDIETARIKADIHRGRVTLGKSRGLEDHDTLSLYSLPRLDAGAVNALRRGSQEPIHDIEDLWKTDSESDGDAEQDVPEPS